MNVLKALSLLSILCFSSFSTVSAQNKTDSTQIKEASFMYIDGFVEGNPDLLASCLSEDLYKFGFRLNTENNDYEHAGVLTYQSAQDLAKKIGDSGGRFNPEAPRQVEILDIEGPIASVKITAVWGYDYALLAKSKNGGWKIEQVLWVSPLHAD